MKGANVYVAWHPQGQPESVVFEYYTNDTISTLPVRIFTIFFNSH